MSQYCSEDVNCLALNTGSDDDFQIGLSGRDIAPRRPQGGPRFVMFVRKSTIRRRLCVSKPGAGLLYPGIAMAIVALRTRDRPGRDYPGQTRTRSDAAAITCGRVAMNH